MLIAPTAVTSSAATGRAQPEQQQQEQDPDGDQLGLGGDSTSDASFSARSIEGWPVT